MKVTQEGLIFTTGERIVLAMACSLSGLRHMAYRTGFWSKKHLSGLPDSFPTTAERLLMRFGDLKMGSKAITKVCAWSMKEIDADVYCTGK